MNDRYMLNRVIEKIIIDEYRGNNAAFAKKVGVSRQFIGEIRNNKKSLGLNSFLDMLDITGKKLSSSLILDAIN